MSRITSKSGNSLMPPFESYQSSMEYSEDDSNDVQVTVLKLNQNGRRLMAVHDGTKL